MIHSSVSICNMALDELPFATIASLDDTSQQAIACRRHYEQAWGEALEMSDWSPFRQRLALTALDENDREGEWLYAYSLPSDVAMEIRLLPPTVNGVVVVSELMAGQTLAYPLIGYNDPGLRYDTSGSTLYANSPDAVLEYIGSTPTFERIRFLFVKALALTLASKLAMPLKKERQLKLSLAQEAKIAWEDAIAKNANSRPQTYGDNFVSEALAARMGYDPTVLGAVYGRGYR